MKTYGLIGHPLGHSFSQRFFSEKFEREDIDAQYVNFDISTISLFPQILEKNRNIRGLNVTIPYKEQIIPYLDALDEEARAIGAVNVIKIDKIYGLVGYNSDIIGFQESISPLIDRSVHKKALVLGTGGASKAVMQGLKNLGISSTCVSRSSHEGTLLYSDLTKDVMREFNVIVNCTPLGTFPNVNQAPDIPYNELDSSYLLYDLVYNPEMTKFLELGATSGARIKNGYEMLELQALAGWRIWDK